MPVPVLGQEGFVVDKFTVSILTASGEVTLLEPVTIQLSLEVTVIL